MDRLERMRLESDEDGAEVWAWERDEALHRDPPGVGRPGPSEVL